MRSIVLVETFIWRRVVHGRRLKSQSFVNDRRFYATGESSGQRTLHFFGYIVQKERLVNEWLFIATIM